MKNLGIFILVAAAFFTMNAQAADKVMTKENGMFVVNTTTLAADVDGYVETTPLKIYVKDDKVDHIEALPNQETPKYFQMVKKGLLSKWNGKKVKSVLLELKPETDAVTGATYTSNAVIENVKRGLQYYQKNKK